MSGYHHTLRFTRSGSVVSYRPPAGATDADIAAAERVREALPRLLAQDPPTLRLNTLWTHDQWFGTGDGKSQPSS